MTVSGIKVQRRPSSASLQELDVFQWPIWTKEVSTFPWTYDRDETCFFFGGDVTVTPVGAAPVRMGDGDLVTFPAGMICMWEIHRAVRKHYTLPSR